MGDGRTERMWARTNNALLLRSTMSLHGLPHLNRCIESSSVESSKTKLLSVSTKMSSKGKWSFSSVISRNKFYFIKRIISLKSLEWNFKEWQRVTIEIHCWKRVTQLSSSKRFHCLELNCTHKKILETACMRNLQIRKLIIRAIYLHIFIMYTLTYIKIL